MTWAEFEKLAELCPNLRDCTIEMIYERDMGYVYREHLEHGITFPRFPLLQRLSIRWDEYPYSAFMNEHRVGIPLAFSQMPHLRRIATNMEGAVFFGLLDSKKGPSNRDWLSRRACDGIAPVEGLTLLGFKLDRDYKSPLVCARSLARAYHSRCIIRCELESWDEDCELAYEAQWFRDVVELRDTLVEEEILNMNVGWRHVPKPALAEAAEGLGSGKAADVVGVAEG